MSPNTFSRRRILDGAAVAVPVGALSLMAPAEAYAAAGATPSRATNVLTR